MNQNLQQPSPVGHNTIILNKLEEAVNQSLDGIALLDSSGQYYYLNQRHLDIFGYSNAEMLGRTWQILYDHQETERLLTEVFPILNKKGFWKGRARGKHKKGHSIIQELSLTLFNEGELICICTDISELLEKENKITLKQERLELALNASGSCYWEWSIADDRTTYSPGFWTQHMGYNDESVAEKLSDFLKLVHPEDREWLEKCLSDMTGTGQSEYRYAYRIKKQNGNFGYFIENGRVTERDNSGKSVRVTGMTTDISEQKDIEINVRDYVERYKLALEHTGIAVWEWDPKTGIARVSSQNTNLLGYDHPSKQTGNIRHLIIDEDVPKLRASLKKYLGNQTNFFEAEIQVRHARGHIVWMYCRAKIIVTNTESANRSLVGIALDITALKEARISLRKKEEQWQRALKASGAGIWEMDIERNLLHISLNNVILSGFNQTEEKNTSISYWKKRLHPSDLHNLMNKLAVPLLFPGTILKCEFRVKNNAGQYVWLEARGAAKKNKGNKVRRLMGIFYDVSDKMNVQQKVMDAKKEAEELVKSKSKLLSIVSHEIKTPINAILDITNSILEARTGAPSFEKIKNIHQSASSLIGIANDVLDLSRLDENRLFLYSDLFSPAELVRNAFSMLQEMADQKGLNYRLQMSLPEKRLFLGDAARLRQILINIIGNTIKFTSAGNVTVIVNLGRFEDGKSKLKIFCQEFGIGIDRKLKSRVLSEYTLKDSRFERQYGGIGLGLTMTNELVKLMGGRLEINNCTNQGSTLYVELPLQHSTAGTKKRKPGPASHDLSFMNGLSFLAVEDNEINSMLLDAHLKKYPINYALADSGAKAISLCQKENYDIILMDIQLPDLNGMDATREIRKLKPDSWIVAMTAHATNDELQHYLDSGMNDYITKPFSESDLLTLIKKYISLKKHV